jgi:hypothetical protein
LEASQQFSFYMVRLLAPCQIPIPEDQASVFISPRGRVATHFSHLLRHTWVMVGLFLFPSHHTGKSVHYHQEFFPRGKSCWSMKLIIHLHLVLKFGNPYKPSWCEAQKIHTFAYALLLRALVTHLNRVTGLTT